MSTRLHILVLVILTNLFIATNGMSAVNVPNPFLRPGSTQKPPPPTPVKPKPVPQRDMSQEIEFRGYFILKGQPFFCLFNKKSNHGEWISLSELTYEEFEAYEFDQSSEILTIKYEGSTYELSLMQGGSSGPAVSTPTVPKPGPVTASTPASPTFKSSTGSSPKYMPPRPTKTPTLPSWLVNRKSPPARSSGGGGSSNFGMIPRRTNSSSFNNSGTTTSPSSTPSNNFTSSPVSSPSSSVPTNTTPSPSSGVPQTAPASNNFSDLPVQNINTNNDLDLENLPPPPPPPNILPPTPPPDILPSREN